MEKAICELKSLMFLIFYAITILPNEVYAQTISDNPKIEGHIYKTRGLTRLKLYVYQPTHREPGKKLPAIIFFHGGGLKERYTREFEPQSKYLVEIGMVAVLATYTIKRSGRTQFESIADVKSAIRWIREHAEESGIDENSIAAGGGSAGGYLAACAGLIKDFDEKSENLSISSVPDALVLFNPRLALPVAGDPPLSKKDIRYLNGRAIEEISPLHNINKGAPPTIIFQGTTDKSVSIEESQQFCEKMKNYGKWCLVPVACFAFQSFP